MKVGDLFAGIGGASLAVHTVIPGAETVWQSDLVNEAVRARHFPGAQQLVGDVRALDPARLPRVDLLTAGFPCTDLSVAGKQAGLDGPASGLYSEVLRFTAAQRPERVLIENVPALLGYLPRLSADFRALGYGLTWTVCEAADAGHPHLRRRVFVLAELDRRGRGAVEVDQAGRWNTPGEREWGTATASNSNESERPESWHARRIECAEERGGGAGRGEPLAQQVVTWSRDLFPVRVSEGGISHGPTVGASESDLVRIVRGSGAAQEVSRGRLGEPVHVPPSQILQLAVFGARQSEARAIPQCDREAVDSSAEVILRELRRRRATRDASQGRELAQQLSGELGDALRILSHVPALAGGQGDADTLAALQGVRDQKQRARLVREALSTVAEVGRPHDGQDQPIHAGLCGRRLNPAFLEALMGYPLGWTEPTGDRIDYTPPPPVRGRYPEDWDRSVPWPGFDWEPPRTLPDGAPVKGRAARIRALGNAWCPAQGALALRALLAPAQTDLFGGAR